jgi:hypothetical protein
MPKPIRAEDQLFDHDLIEAMRLAFRKACEALKLGDTADASAELVAEKIIGLAKAGEIDPERLCSHAVHGFSELRQAS